MRFAYKTPRFVYPLFFHHINNKKINVKFFLSFLHSVAYRQFSRLVCEKLGKLRISINPDMSALAMVSEDKEIEYLLTNSQEEELMRDFTFQTSTQFFRLY